MYATPLTAPTILPVPQSQLNPWEQQLDHPRAIQGLSGLSGVGLGLGCADCGGGCGSCGPKSGGLGDVVSDLGPFTSLAVHGIAVLAAVWFFKSVFFSGGSVRPFTVGSRERQTRRRKRKAN